MTVLSSANLNSTNSDTMPHRTSPVVSHRFVYYRASAGAQPKVGLVDNDELNVSEVLGYSNLFQLIEAHPALAADYEFKTGQVTQLSSVEILAPLPGRDIL